MWKLFVISLVAICIHGQEDLGDLCVQDASYSCQCNYLNNQKFLSVSVDCHARNITIFYPELTIPEYTEVLDLSVNRFESVPINGFFNNAPLSKLLLNNNKIKEISDSAFDGLSTLKSLDLSNNNLKDLKPGVFHGIFKLESLNLAGNQFALLEHGVFQFLPKLNSLNLNHNPLGKHFETSLDIFTSLGLSLNPKLEVLELKNIQATVFVEDFLKSAYNLRRLDISENDIDSIPTIPFTTEYLDISSTQIRTLTPRDFTNLPALSHLIANNLTELTEISNHTFFILKNLQYLSIQSCKKLEHFNEYAFGVMILENNTDYEFTLKDISFLGSGLKTLDERLLPYFSRLSSLDLRGNPWNCDCDLKWIKTLQLNERDKEFIRCYYPKKYKYRELFLMADDELVCESYWEYVHWALLNILIFFCVMLSCFAMWLVFIWPRSKNRVAPEPGYTQITLEPNNAEDIP